MRELQKAARAIPRALKGDWRDVKTLFEFAGIYPAKETRRLQTHNSCAARL
jgi:hypothetical protein